MESIIPGESPMLTAQPPLPPVATAAQPTAPVTVNPPPAPSTPGGGYAVQLGAFQNYANAQNFLAHVRNQLADAQVEPKVREANGLYRVYVGPYADREEARRVADRISNAFGMATAVAPH